MGAFDDFGKHGSKLSRVACMQRSAAAWPIIMRNIRQHEAHPFRIRIVQSERGNSGACSDWRWAFANLRECVWTPLGNASLLLFTSTNRSEDPRSFADLLPTGDAFSPTCI